MFILWSSCIILKTYSNFWSVVVVVVFFLLVCYFFCQEPAQFFLVLLRSVLLNSDIIIKKQTDKVYILVHVQGVCGRLVTRDLQELQYSAVITSLQNDNASEFIQIGAGM